MKKILLLIVVIACASFDYKNGIYQGLIAAWKFDNSGSKYIVSKVNHKDVLSSVSSADIANNSFHSNGSGSTYQLNANSSVQKLSSTFTASIWVKRTSGTSAGGMWFYDLTGPRNCWSLQFLNTGQVSMLVQINSATNAYSYKASIISSYNVWYHIVMVFDGNKSTASDRIMMYVNGINITGLTVVGTIPTTLYNPQLAVLRVSWTTTEAWHNTPEVWNRPLTSSEVLQLYNYEKNFIR